MSHTRASVVSTTEPSMHPFRAKRKELVGDIHSKVGYNMAKKMFFFF